MTRPHHSSHGMLKSTIAVPGIVNINSRSFQFGKLPDLTGQPGSFRATQDKGHVDRPVQDVGGFEWAADGAFLYTSLNARRRPCMVRRHVLGTDPISHDSTGTSCVHCEP